MRGMYQMRPQSFAPRSVAVPCQQDSFAVSVSSHTDFATGRLASAHLLCTAKPASLLSFVAATQTLPWAA